MTGPVLSNHNDHSTWSIINKTPRKKKILPSFNYKSKWASIKILGMQNSTKLFTPKHHTFFLVTQAPAEFCKSDFTLNLTLIKGVKVTFKTVLIGHTKPTNSKHISP